MNATATASPLSAVQKACRILSELSDPGPHRLSNIVANTGVNKATALRLLETLVEEGFVMREADKGYALGNEALAMKAAVARRANIADCARASLIRLAEVSGDAACLSIPCGSQSVCIDREEGSYPLRVNYLQVGRRLPLGVGSAGLAMLAWLPDDEIDRMMARNRVVLAARFPRVSEQRILGEVRASRERGYALSSNVVSEGTGGISVPILDADGRPVAALGATALVDRLVARERMLAELLVDEAARIEAALQRSAVPRAAVRPPRQEVADVRA